MGCGVESTVETYGIEWNSFAVSLENSADLVSVRSRSKLL
jgi:hypothetical protein